MNPTPPEDCNCFSQLPRMAAWLALALLLLVAVWLLAPQQLPVSLYKLSLVVTAAVAGYWIDRGLFPYARPDRIELKLPPGAVFAQALAMSIATLRRAIIVAAAMVAMGLGA
jgi:hypothetical protein